MSYMKMVDGPVKKENMTEDTPEDLSAKHKTVSVQTENWQQDKFSQIFEGCSQNQIKLLMSSLIQFLLKSDNIIESEPISTDICEKSDLSSSSRTGWTPLEPESSASKLFKSFPNKSSFLGPTLPPPLIRINSDQKTGNPDPCLHPVSCLNLVDTTKEESRQTCRGDEGDPEVIRDQQKIETRTTKREYKTTSSERTKQFDFHPIVNMCLSTCRVNEEEESETGSFYQGCQSRDDRLIMDMNIPFTVEKIIHKPMEEFNDLLASQTVTEEQMNICRDIRRRGKNKIAAQNCRKRKIDQITCLENDLSQAKYRKVKILSERVELLRQQQEWKMRLEKLEEDIIIRLGKEQKDWMIILEGNIVKLERK